MNIKKETMFVVYSPLNSSVSAFTRHHQTARRLGRFNAIYREEVLVDDDDIIYAKAGSVTPPTEDDLAQETKEKLMDTFIDDVIVAAAINGITFDTTEDYQKFNQLLKQKINKK